MNDEFWHDVEADYLRKHPDRGMEDGLSLSLPAGLGLIIAGLFMIWILS